MTADKTILVVEDDELFRRQLCTFLEDLGYTVIKVGSARAALECMKSKKGQIGIVFLDILLPDGSGLDTIGELIALDPGLVILVLTAYAHDEAYRATAERMGVFSFIGKSPNWPEVCKRRVAEGSRFRALQVTCDKIEQEQRQLEEAFCKHMDFGRFSGEFLQGLRVPFDAEDVILHVGHELAELTRLQMMPARNVKRLEAFRLAGIASSESALLFWIPGGKLEQDPVWIYDLAEAEFPLKDGSLMIPVAPSNRVLAFLEVPFKQLPYFSRPFLERWQRFCDVVGVRLLCSVNLYYASRLEPLRRSVHELARVSNDFSSFLSHIQDNEVRRALQDKVECLNSHINVLRVTKNLIAVKEESQRRQYDPNLILFEIHLRYDSRLAAVGGRWELDLGEEVSAFTLDRVKLQASIENLVINAIEAFGSQPRAVQPVIKLSSRAVDQMQWVEIVVADNGPGLPATATDPFSELFTTKEPAEDRGQGLALVREAIESMSGTVNCQEHASSGCRFLIRLPVDEDSGDENESRK